MKRQNAAAASDRLAQSNRQKIAQDDFEKSFNESLARGTLIKDLNAKGINVDAISFKTNPVTGKAENIQGYKWLDTGTKQDYGGGGVPDVGPDIPKNDQAIFGSYSASQAKAAFQNPTKTNADATRAGYANLQNAEREAGAYYTEPVFGSLTRSQAANALYSPNVKARQEVQDFNVKSAYEARQPKDETLSASSEKLGPESPFGIYSPKEDLNLKAIPRDADILPLAAGTPIGQSKLKASDPNNPLTYLTTPYESLARFGYQASKGFSPYEEFKSEYEEGAFPFKSSDTPSSALTSATGKTLSNLVGGQGFDTSDFAQVGKDVFSNPAKAIGSTLGEAPLFFIPVGEAAGAAKSGISAGVKAVPKGLSDLSLATEAGIRTTAGLTKTGTIALDKIDAFNTSALEKLTATGSKIKTGVSQPFNVAKTEFSYAFQPIKETVTTKATAAGEKLVDFGGTLKEDIANPLNVAKTEINYGLAPTKEVISTQTKAIANQFSDFGGTLKEGITQPVSVAKTEISYGLQPAKDFVSTQAENIGGKLSDAGDILNRNVKMSISAFGTEIRYGVNDLKGILTPKNIGTPSAFEGLAKGYRSAKASETAFRFNLDKPFELPKETVTETGAKPSGGFDFGNLTPKSLVKFKASYDINKLLIQTERAAGKNARPESIFKRGFDFGPIQTPKTPKQPKTSNNPLENIGAQVSDFIIKPAYAESGSSSTAKSIASTAAAFGISKSLGLGGGTNVFAENTQSLGLGGVTGAGRTRKTRTTEFESVGFSRIPDVDSMTRDFMSSFTSPKIGSRSATTTKTTVSENLGFGDVTRFNNDTTGRQGFTGIEMLDIVPKTRQSSRQDIFTGLNVDSFLKDTTIQAPGLETGTQTREITDLIRDLEVPTKSRTREPEAPRLPKFDFGFEKPERRRKKGKKGKYYGRTFKTTDPLAAFAGGSFGKTIQKFADKYG